MFQSSVILVLNSNMHYVANLQDKRNEKIWLENNDLLFNYSFEIVSYKMSAILINSHQCFYIPTPNTTLCTPHVMRVFDEMWFAIYCEMDYRSHVVSCYLPGSNCKVGINGFLEKRASITVVAGTAVGAEPDQKQYPRIYNLTENFLESSPSVLKHPPGPTNRVHGISPVALLMVNKKI